MAQLDLALDGNAGRIAKERNISLRALTPWLISVLLLAIVALIAFPIGRMIVGSFWHDGTLTAEPIRDALGDPGVGKVLWNTVVYTVGTLLAATVIGGLLAWVNERTDASIRGLGGILPLIPLLVPPIGSALGYVLLLDSRSGLVNTFLRGLVGSESDSGPLSIANFPGLIFVSAINFAPLAYLVISAALRNVDPSLDEASRVAGAGHLRTLFKVAIPVVRPSIASGALVVGIMAAGAYTFPLIIGTSAEITTLPVYIFRLFSIYPPREEEAIALGLLMLVAIQVAVWFQMRASRSANRAVVAGKRSSTSRIRLSGPARGALRVFVITYLLAVIVPLVGLVIGSLQPYRTSTLDLSAFTLDTYRQVLSDPITQESLANSFMLAAGAATLVVACSATLTAASSRSFRRGGRLVDAVLFLPASIPHTVIGAAFLFTFTREPFVLYGTPFILLFAYVVAFMPQGAAASASAISQANKELTEAASVCGAGPWRTLRRVVVPQVAPGLMAAWIIVFFLSVNEVTASALLASSGNSVVGHLAVDFFSNGSFAQVAVLALVVTVVTAAVVGVTGSFVSKTFRAGGMA